MSNYTCANCRDVDGVPVRNLSGETKVIGSTTRHNERTNDGRFARRGSTQVRPLPKPEGEGGIDAVTGRWIPGVRNQAVLFRSDALDGDTVHIAKDWSNGPPINVLLDFNYEYAHGRYR